VSVVFQKSKPKQAFFGINYIGNGKSGQDWYYTYPVTITLKKAEAAIVSGYFIS
jgi:hypothetical protein